MTVIISTGCPSSIGPEVSVRAASGSGVACVLVGDQGVLQSTAAKAGLPALALLDEPSPAGLASLSPGLYLLPAPGELEARDCRPGKPTPAGGAAQLQYVRQAATLCRSSGLPLVTAAVSKSAIAQSGAPGAKDFRGHTEWLAGLEGGVPVTMCFVGPKLACSLATTHIPLSQVPEAVDAAAVERAAIDLVTLLRLRDASVPKVAVCSLNPHAGEDELLGHEERLYVAPGVEAARMRLGSRAILTGPIGAETAFRKMAGHAYAGVVALYHDQATIPMKLMEFGTAVNVTMGLSYVRTSVDHGTAYDIAGTGSADATGMSSAIALAARLGRA